MMHPLDRIDEQQRRDTLAWVMTRLLGLMIVILVLAVICSFAAPQGAAPQQSALPQTAPLTLDKALEIIKDANFKQTLQIAWQTERIGQLEQRILSLTQELDDLKKTTAKPAEAKKGND